MKKDETCPHCGHELKGLKPDDVREIRRLHAEGISLGYIATKFAISTSYACDIVHRKRKAHVP